MGTPTDKVGGPKLGSTVNAKLTYETYIYAEGGGVTPYGKWVQMCPSLLQPGVWVYILISDHHCLSLAHVCEFLQCPISVSAFSRCKWPRITYRLPQFTQNGSILF